ncbi:hypothetical protein G4G28_16225 [Massilia sp. Dwa41.01b]|uniref:hypothetical protein n=1 Tax=Massilia sp. Dwa41.01b TaxID=2709302 RepID=UPI0016030F21|nr:hypothetical protein [Massilia sp. Dwa41.01b]QNA87231.1 hypothetical protein G4G28_16225 [Massilia sp. Dwa41.01b]
MKHALTKIYAGTEAMGPRLARVARQGVAVCVLACAGIGAARHSITAVATRPRCSRHRRRAPNACRRLKRRATAHPDQQRYYDQQRAAEEQQRRQVQEAPPERRGGRLTPDERRDLRRQINEAGMDIYPNARRR